MKTFFFILLFTTVSAGTFAQNLSDLDQYPLKSKEDCKKAEAKVVDCVDYLFGHPASKSDGNRTAASQFVVKWMTNTDYSFSVDATIVDLTKGNNDLFALYMAGMCKVVLSNPAAKLSDDEIKAKVTTLLVAYCKVETNNCKPSKALKKLM